MEVLDDFADSLRPGAQQSSKGDERYGPERGSDGGQADEPAKRYRLYTETQLQPKRIVCAPDAAFELQIGPHRMARIAGNHALVLRRDRRRFKRRFAWGAARTARDYGVIPMRFRSAP